MVREIDSAGSPAATPTRRRVITVLLAAFTLQACAPWPRDPERTLDESTGGTLRVGASEAPPSLTRGEAGAMGPEADMVEAFARSIDARVEWRWGALDAHLEALERYELDLVAGGLSAGSPWKGRVAFTRPWRQQGETRHALAVPPGENGMLVAVERVIEFRKAGEAR
jgi:hypothetical protein